MLLPPISTLAAPGATRAAGIAAGVLLDCAFGDPRRGHPVAGFGELALRLERLLYRPTRGRGVLFTLAALAVPITTGLAAELAGERLSRSAGRAGRFGRVAQISITAAATWAALGGTSLAREGRSMARSLESGDLPAARNRLTHLCARDPDGLDPEELARATVESLAENTSDAVVAPLLWAAVAGVPGVLGYRAANTLDAMVGYRSPRYQAFGWAPARLDDVLNLVPARVTGALTVAAAPVAGGRPRHVWAVMRRDAAAHPSPNAGWCEASAAAALGVQLGGANVYAGRAEVRPALGAGGRAVTVPDVRRAVRLGQSVSAGGAVLAVTVALAIGRIGRIRRRWRRAGE